MAESMSKITAHRNGQTREFTKKQWEVMGTGHCGWSAVPEVPREVAQAVVIKPAPIDYSTPTQTRKKRRK